MNIATWLVPALLVADQAIKLAVLWAVGPKVFEPGVGAVFIAHLFWVVDLTFIPNSGAAFGIFQGGARVLVWVSLAVGFGLLLYLSLPSRRIGLLPQVALSLVAAGALGNAIDRLGHGWVVDYVDINRTGIAFLDNYPIWNLADACVVVGVILLLLPQRRRRY
ncbi:Lipoprotein signal peptidase [Meiothermus luteus]|jgi:signal peptidase II|uniref:Lipoprotein signal peptidase n=1 Tax=Meiothermus luteus TaxID=2026184 RepID=A0A399F0P1_9DEIN|nr:signal peptidase II [Meiothermus luteus]RIH89206.1 Lipoprotein signal peptidase [Meiothermus luteus]RMH55755.1 MAG: signal peptidase II [Deinococcota bacterium]